MPAISTFYGITIKMYFLPGEHNPPHIHAAYADNAAMFAIADATLINGNLPPKAMQLVAEWIESNKEELLKMWNSQEFKTLPPLK